MEYNNKVSALLLSKRIRKKVGSLYINERSYPIYIGVNTIGRNRDAIVNIKNLNVSTHHAVITALDESKVYISDINSSNGTQVNDTKLAPFELHLLPADESTQISFGYLTGMYKHDLDPEASSFEMTQNATQSLYFAQTQIMSNSNLHEEATQIQSLEPNVKVDDDIEAQLCDDMLDNCDAKTQYMPLINYADTNEEELIEEIVMNDDEVTQVMNLNPDRSAANISEINSNGVNDSATIINETVYDDSICSKPRASTFIAEFSESSNDSIDFLQPNLKPVKTVDVHCESDSDESIVVPNRATKSRQLLSDDSDTDIEGEKDWNDSDVIPATQNMSVNKSQKSLAESEGSFKLGLSELENESVNLDTGKKFSFRKAAVILGDVSLTKILAKPDESLIDDSRKLEEIQNGGASEVAESAQKMAENVETIEEANDLAGNDETVASNEEIDLKAAEKSIGKANTSRELKVRFSDNDVFVKETQKIDIEEDNNFEVSGDNEIYMQATQKIVENNLDVEGEDTLEVSRGEGDEEIYFQPTQKLAGNSETIEEAIDCDESIYDKETQAMEPQPTKEIVVNLDDSDIYNKETQKMVVEDSEEEIFSRETQKLGEIASTSKENETISDESAIFTAATQKIAAEKQTPIKEKPISERPTQKLAAPSKLSLASRKSTRKITPSKKLEASCSTPQNQNQPSTTHVTLRKKYPKRVSVKTEELSPVRKRTKLPSTSDEDDVSLAALVPPKIDQSFVMAEAKSKRLRRNVNNEVTDVKDLQLTVKNRNSMNITNVDLVRSTRSSKQIATNVNNNSIIVEAGTSKVEPKKRGKALQEKKRDTFVAPAMVKIEKENTDVKARARRHTSVTSLGTPPVATASVPKRRFTQVSPERSRRKQRPRVVFTMFENPVMESWIRQLGGMMVDNVENCTVLITEQVKRSAKLLTAVGLGKPICSPQWIVDSRKAAEFLDPWENILIDKAAEEKWSFSLKDSLQRAQNARLLEDFRFQLLSTANLDVLKGAIEACGGKCMVKLPPKRKGTKLYVVSNAENKSKWSKIVKQNDEVKVIEAEAIFDGVLRQELHFEQHYLS